MPKVGNKHYAYTPTGIAAAKKAAKKKGTPLKMSARAEAAMAMLKKKKAKEGNL